MKLYEITENILQLEQILQEDLSESEQLEIIEKIMEAEGNFTEKTDNTLAYIKTLESYIESYKTEIDRLSKLKRSSLKLRKTLRSYLLNQLERLGISKLKTKRFKVSKQKTKKKLVLNKPIVELPDEYLVSEVSLDMDKLRQDLESGKEVDFASLENQNILVIR